MGVLGKLYGVILCLSLIWTSLLQRPEPKKTAYLPAGDESGLPLVQANNNKQAAGVLVNGELNLEMELTWSDFRPETPDRPGVSLWAFNEKGELPQIPAPLIRVEEGTQINITFTNTHPDSVVTLFGLTSRPDTVEAGIEVNPGTTKSWKFDAGEVGSFFYYAKIGFAAEGRTKEREQLAGALIIDPKGYNQEDEVIVINIWSTEYDSTYEFPFLQVLTMNGKSWPFSERFTPSVGDSLNWKVINASRRNHPMHLHGFYYDVLSIGNAFRDEIYESEGVRKVVTEFMLGRTTMALEWVPTRSGNWVFHCHLSFHVAPDIRLPGSETMDEKHVHMAGLVMGIEVLPGDTDLIWKGESRKLTMIAKELEDQTVHQMGFDLINDSEYEYWMDSLPSPTLVLHQYQAAEVTVTNTMSQPTGIHWHGLELDSWADGVPGYSASDGKMSPTIKTGQSFTYKLSTMRPGTFIYHSHLNDIEQITSGLYGPLIVLPEGESYNPDNDHIYILQWRNQNPQTTGDIEVNGIPFANSQKPMEIKVGERHRLRMINIAPAGNIYMEMLKDSVSVPMLAWAKDGADLPASQQVMVDFSPRLGVGETADFFFEPTEPGIYELSVGYGDPQFRSRQKWIVSK